MLSYGADLRVRRDSRGSGLEAGRLPTVQDLIGEMSVETVAGFLEQEPGLDLEK